MKALILVYKILIFVDRVIYLLTFVALNKWAFFNFNKNNNFIYIFLYFSIFLTGYLSDIQKNLSGWIRAHFDSYKRE